MSVFGKRRGRVAAVSGLAALALAQMVSDGVGKQLSDGPGLSEERIERDGFEERSPSSIFLSGQTAAAVAFTAALAATWPLSGGLCAVPATLLAVERVRSGAQCPVDIAAGAVIGLGSAWFARHFPRLLRQWLQR